MEVDWFDPGHDLPPDGTYRDLDAWVGSDGIVHVGNRAVRVVPADAYRGAVSDAERLRAWLYYISETTNDDNVLAACELAEKGEAPEFDTSGGQQ